MQKLIECVPNFSEGKDEFVIKAIVNEINSNGVKVLNYELDPDHNRSVVTFAGYEPQIFNSAFNACKKAAELIDLTKHIGCHPRIGAMDVLPFIPIKGISFDELVEKVRVLAKRIGDEIKIPVYVYGMAALKLEHENLAEVRKGCYEELKEKVKIDPPDFGPAEVTKCGAVAIGVRKFLIAYNINLNTPNVEIAKMIAKKIRERNGGLFAVKALGLELKSKGITQVSINLVDFEITSIQEVFNAVSNEAEKFGVEIKESELIGLIPEAALKNLDIKKVKLLNFSEDKILENRLKKEGFEI
jgi:glutamate formiminotransferase / 5-formyltetrahydrofolate cyclo-ligase